MAGRPSTWSRHQVQGRRLPRRLEPSDPAIFRAMAGMNRIQKAQQRARKQPTTQFQLRVSAFASALRCARLSRAASCNVLLCVCFFCSSSFLARSPVTGLLKRAW